LAAAIAVVGVEVTLIGLTLTGATMLQRDLSLADDLAFGLSVAATGLAFTGLAALAAQVAATGRGAGAVGAAVLGLAFLLRAFGDTDRAQGGSGWASWLSPLGWANQTRVFVDTRWWPILLPLAFALVTGGVAWVLAGRRDQGAGLVAARNGPAEAAKDLLSLSGLVWRRTRGSLLAWGGGAAALGLTMGPIISDMTGYIRDNPYIAAALGVRPDSGLAEVTAGFTALITAYMALLMAAFAILAVNAFHSDELAGLIARQLAEPVSRRRLLASVESMAGLGALLGMSVAGVSYLLVVAADDDLGREAALDVATATLHAFPGLILTVALASFLVAALPKLTVLNWIPFSYAFAYSIVGQALNFPEWCRYLSPLSALAFSPDEAWSREAMESLLARAAVLLAVAAALFYAGHRRFAARDLLA
jgi:ABC-2 type transport system permease protein